MKPVLVSAKAHSLTVSLGGSRVYTYDRLGRPFYAFEDRRTYKIGLSGRVLEKSWEAGPEGLEHIRADLPEAERCTLLSRTAAAAAQALAALKAGAARLDVGVRGASAAPPAEGDPPAPDAWLERAAAYSWENFCAHAEAFRRVWLPITILPPDQYLALVLQATEGCSYNRCTFCNFYRDRSFRVRRPEEFRAHLRDVQDFLGPTLGLRRSLFLADANALAAPQQLVREYLRAAAAEFPLHSGTREVGAGPVMAGGAGGVAGEVADRLVPGGIYSFLDVFSAAAGRPRRDYAELAELGLRRVYIGLESGSRDLLRFLGKPGSPADAVQLVHDLRAAGVHSGVIILVGAGGNRYAARHLAETVAVLRAMALGPGDIIYLSPFVAHPGVEYAGRARAEGVQPLDPAALAAQLASLRSALAPPPGLPGPRVSLYDIREFIW